MSPTLLTSTARAAQRLLTRSVYGPSGCNLQRLPFSSSNRCALCLKASNSAAPLTRQSFTRARRSLLVQPFQLAVDPLSWQGDLLVIAVNEEDFKTEGDVTSIKSESLAAMDKSLGGALMDIIEPGGFDGKQGVQSRVLRVSSGAAAKYVAMIGLGKADKTVIAPEWGPSAYQVLGSGIAAMAKASKVKTVALTFLNPIAPAAPAEALQRVAAGVMLGSFESTRFKSKKGKDASRLVSVDVLMELGSSGSATALTRAQAIASGTTLTRYLVEAPPNVCTPTHIANAAAHIASLFPDRLTLEVLEKEDCEKMGMGCYLGVAEASAEPLKFIHLVYKPEGDVKKKVAIVGKGLCFDSGGYNIKAGAGSLIEVMKFDMGGSAATLGAARIIGALKPTGVEVHFIVAACENMIDGRGMRPGDVLTSANGKTVEINNTDAEGRLTLADALWFAQEKCGVKTIVDIATLTGACIVGLGTDIGGLMTPSDEMAKSITAASRAAGEKVWRLPMEQSYYDGFKSSVADMKNAGGRFGGAISASLFLKEFINEGVEWAHLDIAGPVWDWKSEVPTGYAAATLAEWAMSQGA